MQNESIIRSIQRDDVAKISQKEFFSHELGHFGKRTLGQYPFIWHLAANLKNFMIRKDEIGRRRKKRNSIKDLFFFIFIFDFELHSMRFLSRRCTQLILSIIYFRNYFLGNYF